MRILWSPEARQDLDEIFEYILSDDPGAAAATLDRIDEAVAMLGMYPAAGRPGRISGTRELVIAGTPFLVAYRIAGRPRAVQVLAVRHGARSWPDDLGGP